MSFLRNLLRRYHDIRACIKRPGRQNSWTYGKYPPDCDFGGRSVLNLGCGLTVFRAPNVTNLDMFSLPGINVTWDLSKTPLPFDTANFDLIIANHILEHVPNWWDCFKELARILKVGGRLEVWLPGDGGSSQLGYRDHINVINHCSFMGVRGTIRNMTNAWEANEQENLGFVKDLSFDGPNKIVLPNWWWSNILPDAVLSFMVNHLRNTVVETGWFFRKMPPMNTRAEYVGNVHKFQAVL